MATYVIVHGAYDGGWAWRGVARELQAAGHEVFTVTLTGSGERAHLASREVGLDTHNTDVANVLRYGNLTDVLLVGHSYGGVVITGVAEQVPERIGQLVYLDALVPEDGQTVADLFDPAVMEFAEQAVKEHGEGWRIPHGLPDADRSTDSTLNVLHQPVTVRNPQAAALKHTYVLFTAKPPEDTVLRPMMERIAARARARGWG